MDPMTHPLSRLHAAVAPGLSRVVSWTGAGGDGAWWALRRRSRVPAGAVWLHGASAGESRAAARLADALGRPCWRTTNTATGAALTGAEPAPLDQRPFGEPPAGLVLVEGEFWPGWLAACAQHDVPVAVLGAAMSEVTARRWARFRGWFRSLMEPVELIGCSSPAVADRFLGLGLEPSRVRVSGSLKAGAGCSPEAEARIAAWKLPEMLPCLASSHEQEESMLGRPHEPGARAVVVPRYPQRAPVVARSLASRGWEVTRTSVLGPTAWTRPGVLLVDELGLLEALYARVGRVLLGRSPRTGSLHDPLAPLAAGLPVAVRPGQGRWDALLAEGETSGAITILGGTSLAAWRAAPGCPAGACRALARRYDGFEANLKLLQEHPRWSGLCRPR